MNPNSSYSKSITRPGTVFLPWITFNGSEFMAAQITDD
jgi:hypothetical protein